MTAAVVADDRSDAAPDEEVQSGGPEALSPVGLYVHVPFCVSVCPYCDFVVYAGPAARGPRSRLDAFVAAVCVEISLRADALGARFGVPGAETRPKLASVYLGGGTPSLLPASDVARLLEAIDARFGIAPGAEITLEANPGSDERGDVAGFVAAGVTRLSIGAQSLRPSLLRTLGRRHTPDDVAATVAAARQSGVGSVSIDLLYDVPGQTLDDWMTTLEAAIVLEPDHLSLYALTLDDPDAEGLTGPFGDHLPVRAGARWWRTNAATAQDEDRAAAQYHHAVHRLADAGFGSYEISNWARPGHESRHNRAYWERRPVEAVGPGAHGFDGVARRWNAATLDGYLAALLPDADAPRLPPGGSEVVAEDDAAAERAILGLRLAEGVPLATAFERPLGAILDWAIALELLELHAASDGPRVRLTTRGRLLSNEVFARLV
ncbi:MAG: radical SAM family heme chaperone HemW [Chloroflexota bacterium]